MKHAPTQEKAILEFLTGLNPEFRLPQGVSIMNPFQDQTALKLATLFYKKFYSDQDARVMIFGINPGRFGGGITGIPFTDPQKLESCCGIPNEFKKVKELSADFIYRTIEAFGGVKLFYHQFFITAVSPLGFVRDGKNMNYYDDPKLAKSIEGFATECIQKQIQTIKTGPSCICLGEGKNYKYLSTLNEKHRFFDQIIPLPHPRWIMQYRRPKIKEYIDTYTRQLSIAYSKTKA